MIRTTHNEHSIDYSEHRDEWECRALSLTAKTLSALKTLINKHDADLRRIDKVEAIYLDGYSYSKPTKCIVTLIDDEKDGKVWVNTVNGNSSRREKVEVNRIAPMTAETKSAIAKAQQADKDTEAARQKAQDAWAAVPRHTIAEDERIRGDHHVTDTRSNHPARLHRRPPTPERRVAGDRAQHVLDGPLYRDR